MAGDGRGILAVWNNCAAGQETTYEAWYREEHLPERVGIPGFHFGRRYEALAATPRFFTYYVTDTPGILTSPAYAARLADPTPRTRAIMNGIFIDMTRTVCRRVVQRGRMEGGHVLTVRFGRPLDVAELDRMAGDLLAAGALRVEGWTADEPAKREIAAEEKIRGVDKKIAAALLVEVGYADEAQRLAAKLTSDLAGRAEVGAYRFLCALTHAEATS